MRPNLMKAKLREDKAVIGFVMLANWPEAIEIVALLGADYVMIDCEHGALGLPEVAGLIRTCEAANITPLVRVSRNAADLMLGYLDAGAQGIIVPGVRNRAEAERAVAAVKYWPQGERGCGYGHALDWLLKQPFTEYIEDANNQTMVITMIEEKEGLENLEEIASTPGVDVIMPGPNDLAHAMGIPGKVNHPMMKEAMERIRKVTAASGKYLWTVAPSGDAAREAIDAGARIVVYGMHRLLIAGATDYLTRARAAR